MSILHLTIPKVINILQIIALLEKTFTISVFLIFYFQRICASIYLRGEVKDEKKQLLPHVKIRVYFHSASNLFYQRCIW